VVSPGCAHLVGVAQAAAGTVVGGQCPVQVLVFSIHIKAKNATAVTKIDGSVGQVVVASPDFVSPKRHGLHQALRPDARDRVAILKSALG
jgi:hypothetical protein